MDKGQGRTGVAAAQKVPHAVRCAVVPALERYEGKQELSFFSGVSAQSVGARAICMHLVEIGPGDRGRAHLHRDHETAVYVASGHIRVWFGARLGDYVDVGPGNFVYIAAGEPHLPVNLSATEPVKAVLARTDPNEQESVVLLPELEHAAHLIA
ncbi:MAG: cupin domain-containing protein [Actinomycetota bacterium]